MQGHVSRPAWARGLKLAEKRSPHVSVKVAPRVGAWIETRLISGNTQADIGRAPRGRVD